MRRILFIISMFIFSLTSCSTEDEIIFVDENGNQIELSEGEFIIQTGIATINGNTLNIPIGTRGIPTDVFRVDIVIYQNGTVLPGGPFILQRNETNFTGDPFQIDSEFDLNNTSNIEIDLYFSGTSSSREFLETLFIN